MSCTAAADSTGVLLAEVAGGFDEAA